MSRLSSAGNAIVIGLALAAAMGSARARADAGRLQNVRPDLLVTSVWAGPAHASRFCAGGTNRVYVTVRRDGGASFNGPIEVWLIAQGVTGRLPTGGIQRIEYIRGASSWLVIFRDVRVDSDWRALDAKFTAVVNPEINGRHAIGESNYNNNSYTLRVNDHADWGRRCE